MSRASLGKIEFNRANLAAKFCLNKSLKRLACARKICVAKNINGAALRGCANICSVSISYTLGYCNYYVGVLCKCSLDIATEFVVIKVYFGKIYVVGSVLACNLTEDETSAALRLLIDLGINEKCKDNTTKATTYWFIISKALYVHAIYKLTELLTEDSCWTIVRDTSLINDYAFKHI